MSDDQSNIAELSRLDAEAGSSSPAPSRRARLRAIALVSVMVVIGLEIAGHSTFLRPSASAPTAPIQPARVYYVSPTGWPGAPGTKEAPLDLATALSKRGPARPGDTIWLRGGSYAGSFRSELTGNEEAPILVRQYPGEHATIDTTTSGGDGLFVNGAWTWYWGFEVTSADPIRLSRVPGGSDIKRGIGVVSHAPGARFINLVVHDMQIGVAIWISSPDSEVYGNLVYHNGYDANDRGHGHGIYAQNKTGSQQFIDNVLFGGFSHGIHAYGSEAAYLNNIALVGNVVFNSGILSGQGEFYERNILLGGGRPAENPVLEGNYTYYEPARRGGENNVGFHAGCVNLRARDNYWAHQGQYPLVIRDNCQGALSGNVMIGASSDEMRRRFPANTYLPQAPTGVKVFIRPNRYEAGRANVIVYNWDKLREVEIDLSQTGLAPGTAYEVRDAQNYFGAPIVSGVYRRDEKIQVSMDGREAAAPAGNVSVIPHHTGREFGVFIVVPKV